VEELLRGLNASTLPLAVEIARLPEQIRGYGHVKERHLAAVRPRWDALLQRWRAEQAGAGGGATPATAESAGTASRVEGQQQAA
jgi:indolepyruvate ferredoxin oxidoreductase